MQRKLARLVVAALAAVVLSTAINAQASLIQWLTATNVPTLQTNASGTVTNWLDASGSANDTLNAGAIIGTPKYPSTSVAASGKAGVDMGVTRNGFRAWSSAAQDSWLDFTGAASGKSGFAVLVAFKIDGTPTNASTRNIVLSSHGNPAANPSFALKYQTGYPACFIGSGGSNPEYINTTPAAALQTGDTVVFAFNYDSATGAWELWDSKSGTALNNTAAINGNFSSAQPMYLGTSENSAQFMNGAIFEVRVYDNVLSSNDLATARQEMQALWVTPSATTLPPTFNLFQPGDSQALLGWIDNNSSGATANFRVYRSLTSGSGYTAIATNATTSYTDSSVVNGTTYYYVLTAFGTNGVESVFSAEKAITPVTISTNAVLIQHLDVADANSNSIISISGQVLSWLDQTANAYDGNTVVGTPLYPSASLSGSGKAGVDLGANSWLAGATNRAAIQTFTTSQQNTWLDFTGTGGALTNGGFSVVVAFKADSIGSSTAANPVLVNQADPLFVNGFGLRFDGSGVMQAFLGGVNYLKSSGFPVTPGDTVIYAFSYDQRTGAIQFWDSKNKSSLLATNTPYGKFFFGDTMKLGSSGVAFQNFDGLVGEVKVYAGKLDSTALVTEGESLATKWGASGPVISTNAVLIQHLDATNSSSIAVVGSQVLTWFDQSGNLNDATPTTGGQTGTPLYPSASLSGSGNAGVDLGINTWPFPVYETNRSGMDLFAVVKQPSFLNNSGAGITNGGFSALVVFKADSVITNESARNPVLVNHGNPATANSFGLRFNGTGRMETFLGGQLYQKANNAPVKAGDTIVYGFNYNSTNGVIEFWDSKNNSTLVATNITGGNFASTQILRLGTTDNNQQQFDGMVGEVKIYKGKLSSAAMIAEGQSLATKWGAALASTNDFFLSNLVLSSGTLSPTFSSNVLSYTASVPNSASNLTVTPTAASTNSVISVRVNGGGYATAASGSPSGLLALNEGANTVDVLVTAENQAFTQTYTVTVTRAAGGPTPENIGTTVSGGNLILNWTDPSWKLATGTNVTAITNIIPGATSPYTNSLGSDPQRYFRLVYP